MHAVKIPAHIALVALLSTVAACATTIGSSDWLTEEEQRIQNGQSSATAIANNFSSIPPENRNRAIDIIESDTSASGQAALVTILNHPEATEAQRNRVLATLMERDGEGTADAIFQATEQYPDFWNAETISYYQKKEYEPAIPRAKESLDNNQLVDESLAFLRSFDSYELNLYILALGQVRDNPELRRKALKLASEMKDESIQAKATPMFETIARNHEEEPDDVVFIAIQYLRQYVESGAASEADTDRIAQQLREVYRETDSPELRESTIEAIAEIRDADRSDLEEELNQTIAGREIELSITSVERDTTSGRDRHVVPRQRQREEVQQPRTRTRTTGSRRPRSYPANYAQLLASQLDRAIDPESSRYIRRRVSDALISYADASNPKSNLARRSYRVFFGGSDAEASARLRQGIGLPGSLSIIVWNIIDEYQTDDMREVVIADMFAMRRWQARIILDLVKRNRI